MLTKLDDLLIDRGFQKFANWFQRLTGKTCFFLGKWMFVFSSSTLVVESAVLLFARSRQWESSLTFFLALIHGLLIWRLDTKEHHWEKGPKEFLNEERITFVPLRTLAFAVMVPLNTLQVLTFIFVGNIIDELGSLWAFLYVAGLYFSACTPLPPSKSKARQWWEKLLTNIDEALSSKPECAPVRAS